MSPITVVVVSDILEFSDGQVPEAVAAEVARLRAENARLLRMLELTPAQAALPRPGQAGFFEAPPGPVHGGSPPEVKVAFFGALFGARTDVYAVRYYNRRTGRAGWVPAMRGGFRKGVPRGERDYLPLTDEVLAAHLTGKTHIGLYPLLDGDKCWWLAADFDGPDAMIEALRRGQCSACTQPRTATKATLTRRRQAAWPRSTATSPPTTTAPARSPPTSLPPSTAAGTAWS